MTDVCDVACGVPGNIEHAELELQSVEAGAVAFMQERGISGNAFGRGSEDGDRVILQQARHATDVVVVMVGQKDSGKLQRLRGQNAFDRGGIARIDGDHFPRVARRVNQPDVIVGECRYRGDLEHRFRKADPGVR
jgi:hypothetical protein